ncbi:hypothetical protein AWC38_SpisGene8111 [Stylophora pistillata]|uniref:Uncharacterized protein n=1 Tax=Stylophora pistillata TaxID=50429 RepID=A0A2B4SEB4_STYPI|nr:hypothetical protein AWC38_SpisGene8111 [Stylophora pistillata]
MWVQLKKSRLDDGQKPSTPRSNEQLNSQQSRYSAKEPVELPSIAAIDNSTPNKSHFEEECTSILTSTPQAKECSSVSSRQQQTHESNQEFGELFPIAAKRPLLKEEHNVDVHVKVQWSSKEKERKLPKDLESLGKMRTQELLSLKFTRENPREHICKSCLALLEKRRGLVENLSKIEKELQELFDRPASTINEHPELKGSGPTVTNVGSTLKKSRLDDGQVPSTPRSNEQLNSQESRYSAKEPVELPSIAAIDNSTPNKSHFEEECTSILTSTPQAKGCSSVSSRQQQTHESNQEFGELFPIAAKRPLLKEKHNVDVHVKVQWSSKEKERKLPKDLESLGKMRSTVISTHISIRQNKIFVADSQTNKTGVFVRKHVG